MINKPGLIKVKREFVQNVTVQDV